MAVLTAQTLDIRTPDQLTLARRTVQEWATRIGFSVVERTKFVTAASEIGRNALVHGKGGTMRIEEIARDGRQGLQLVFQDQGPGIADVQRAMTDGFSTANSMGLGLGGTKRLVNEFDISSTPGQGTRVVITQWKRR
ncbi:MAG: anti-sigma regulatory factor [Burkholderiales bacterium]|nr:anti-sigma regulatory factor [Burkholderiales bacterium]